MSFKDLQTKVIDWAEDKDLLHVINAPRQFLKFVEEVFEFKTEMDISVFDGKVSERFLDNLKLEMGDIFVTLIILCKQIGIDPIECLEKAYNKISKRKGRTIRGTFVKEEDL